MTQSTGMALPNCNSRFVWRKTTRPLASCEAETIKESIADHSQTKRKAEIASVFVLSKVLSLDNLPFSQIWKIEKGRENEKVGNKRGTESYS